MADAEEGQAAEMVEEPVGAAGAVTLGSTPLRPPTIKGIFVNTHVAAVRRELGRPGVEALARAFGRSLRFGMTEDVPVRDEVRLIELSLDLLAREPVPPEERTFEAGRLHFRNFATTAYARLLFTLFPRNFHFMMMHARTVAERVFKGVQVQSQALGPQSVRILMQNNDYPLDHFRGLFYQWLRYLDYEGDVRARVLPGETYEYTMTWS